MLRVCRLLRLNLSESLLRTGTLQASRRNKPSSFSTGQPLEPESPSDGCGCSRSSHWVVTMCIGDVVNIKLLGSRSFSGDRASDPCSPWWLCVAPAYHRMWRERHY